MAVGRSNSCVHAGKSVQWYLCKCFCNHTVNIINAISPPSDSWDRWRPCLLGRPSLGSAAFVLCGADRSSDSQSHCDSAARSQDSERNPPSASACNPSSHPDTRRWPHDLKNTHTHTHCSCGISFKHKIFKHNSQKQLEEPTWKLTSEVKWN